MVQVRHLVPAAFLAFAAVSGAARAQVATAPSGETFAKTIVIGGQFSQIPYSTQTVYTVPAGYDFRMTDLILTNYSSTDYCDVVIQGMSYEIRVAPNSTSTTNMLSGPNYYSGQTVVLDNTWRLPGHGTNCEPVFTIMGYLYKPPL